jgi:ribonuclease HI
VLYNNEAEARALLATLQLARTLQARALLIHCDSDVVVRLAQNASSTEAARLAPLFAEIRSQIKCFDQFELRWIPQHRNTEADNLSRSAFGLPTRTPAKPRKRK